MPRGRWKSRNGDPCLGMGLAGVLILEIVVGIIVWVKGCLVYM